MRDSDIHLLTRGEMITRINIYEILKGNAKQKIEKTEDEKFI